MRMNVDGEFPACRRSMARPPTRPVAQQRRAVMPGAKQRPRKHANAFEPDNPPPHHNARGKGRCEHPPPRDRDDAK